MKGLRIVTILALALKSLGTASSALAGAANPTIAFPTDMVTANTNTGTLSLPLSGVRCQFDCSKAGTGTTDVGVSASGFAFTAAGTSPTINLYSDGKQVASLGATRLSIYSDSAYDVWTYAVQTQCQTTRVCTNAPGTICTSDAQCGGLFLCQPKFCNDDGDCPGTNELCAMCDGTGACGTFGGTSAPCTATCAGGPTPGAACTSSGDCGGALCLRTCRLLKYCATATTPSQCGNNPTFFQDCTVDGAAVVPSSDPNSSGVATRLGSAPMHAATLVVSGFEQTPNLGGPTAGTAVLGSAQSAYRVRLTTTANPKTNCSTFCGGVPDLKGAISCN